MSVIAPTIFSGSRHFHVNVHYCVSLAAALPLAGVRGGLLFSTCFDSGSTSSGFSSVNWWELPSELIFLPYESSVHTGS